MKFFQLTLVLLCALFSLGAAARAEITLFNQNDWRVGLYGFLEFDSFYDTTRGFVETAGNNPVPRKGTYNGDNGRTQFSMRNSRFGLNIVAPETDGWVTHGVLEMDFLGYDPTPSTASPANNSSSGFIANPTLRMRHAYFTAEKNDLQLLVGQTWSLFGWQPAYILASISVNPDAATLYQRLVRLGAIKTLHVDDSAIQLGVSIERPTDPDAKIPNLVLGTRWAFHSRKSGFTGPNSDIQTQPMSIALSGEYRNFAVASFPGADDTGVSSISAYAFAADALIPILASSDGKDVSNTLTLVGEFSIGKGYGDEFPSWSGGLGQTYAASTGAGTATSNNNNLDGGLGGYDSAGNFEILNLRTYNAQLQYHFEGKTFATVGYGQIFSSNLGNFKSTTTPSPLYDREEAKFVNVGHDLTRQIRVAVEFDQYTTHYVADGATNFDNRYMVASYFRF